MTVTIRNLTVSIGGMAIVKDVSLTVGDGDRVGIVGESGAGKTLLAMAIMGLLPSHARVRGHIDPPLRRGRDVSMVYQEPMTALNPTMKIGKQVAEAVPLTTPLRMRRGRESVAEKVIGALKSVGLDDAARIARSYPHQLSGGQRQRVLVAMATMSRPRLLICDEPTTAMDALTKNHVLNLLSSAARASGSGLMVISHDVATITRACDTLVVMYGGRIVERGPTEQVLSAPRHRYTQGLLASARISEVPRGQPLPTIPGTVPSADSFPRGCEFSDRCPVADTECSEHPDWQEWGRSGFRCWHPAPVGGGYDIW